MAGHDGSQKRSRLILGERMHGRPSRLVQGQPAAALGQHGQGSIGLGPGAFVLRAPVGVDTESIAAHQGPALGALAELSAGQSHGAPGQQPPHPGTGQRKLLGEEQIQPAPGLVRTDRELSSLLLHRASVAGTR